MNKSDNYRDINLTCILSKIAERVISQPLAPHLKAVDFDISQWTFWMKLSARDLVTTCAARWALITCRENNIDLYLSDISCVLDKISRTLLIQKFSSLGRPESFREGFVTVEGAESIVMELSIMSFQDTVLDSMLRDSFVGNDASETFEIHQILIFC